MAARLCRCGCGASLDDRRAGVEFVNDTHRKRAARKRGDEGEAPAPVVAPPPAPSPQVTPAPPVTPPLPIPSPPASSPPSVTRDEADRRKAVAQAELAELELAKARGDLVPVKESEDRIARFVASVRAQLLAVVGDIRQEIPALTREQVAKVDGIVRRRLEVTAGAAEAGEL
jgi:3-oxoacyl-ACP reductase-like protein